MSKRNKRRYFNMGIPAQRIVTPTRKEVKDFSAWNRRVNRGYERDYDYGEVAPVYTNYYKRSDDYGIPTKDFRLFLPKEQAERFRAMYDVSETQRLEWLALGDITIRKGKITINDDVFVPQQESTSGYCEATGEANAKMIMSGKRIRFWFHTHPNMGAFWSGIDVATSDRLAATTDVFVSLVIGMDHKMLAKLQMFNRGLMYELPIEIEGEKQNPYFGQYLKVFKKNVSKQVYKPLPPISRDDDYYGYDHQGGHNRPLVNTPAAQSNQTGYRDYTAREDRDEEFLKEAQELIRVTNENRKKVGLPPLAQRESFGEIRGLPAPPARPLHEEPSHDTTANQPKEPL